MGYRKSRNTIIRDPEPTEVMPTTTPPTIPMTTVDTGFTVRSRTSRGARTASLKG